jgi:hypothetical protein
MSSERSTEVADLHYLENEFRENSEKLRNGKFSSFFEDFILLIRVYVKLPKASGRKYLVPFKTTVIIQNLIQAEIKRKLNSGNASLQKFCLPVCCLKRNNWNLENCNFACGSVWV